MKKNAFKKAISKLKPKEQACCSVEIEENKESKKESKKENTSNDQKNNKSCC
ncbi:hypothetical protein [Staphylococcus simulans]|uniref:hypothetical protein n=1 Tax=Staphylococcus simulans TaxID=1286 RepID=UPI003F7D3951